MCSLLHFEQIPNELTDMGKSESKIQQKFISSMLGKEKLKLLNVLITVN